MKNFAKSKGKRITAALLCAVMCIMSLPLSAFAFTAEEGKTVDAYYGDRYFGSDGDYYYSPESHQYIAYDENGNTSLHSASGVHRRTKLMIKDSSGSRQIMCIESGIDYNAGGTYSSVNGKNSSYFQNLPTTAQYGIMLTSVYGWRPGTTAPISGTNEDDFSMATQTILWEYQQQLRTSPTTLKANSYGVPADTYYQCIKGRPAEKCYGEITAAQYVIERNGCGLSCKNSHTMRFLRNILVVGLLGYGIGAGHKIVDLNFAFAVGSNGLIYSVTDNGELDTIHLAVFGSLDDLRTAVADLKLDKRLYRVGNGCSIGHCVLNTAIGTVLVIRPDKDTTASHASACRDSNITGRSIVSGDSQLISGNREVEAGCAGREGKLGKYIVRVSQFGNVLTAVPFQFNGCRLACALTHKARILNMALNTGNDAAVIGINAALERMTGADNRFHSIFTARAHMIKVRITLTDNGFPYEKLRSDCVSHLIGICIVLGFPRSGDVTLIAILHDSAEQDLDVIRLNGVVILAGIIIPEVFAKTEIGITDISRNTGFNAVADFSVIGIHTVNGRHIGCSGAPTVHIGLCIVSPGRMVINLNGVPITGIRDHIRLSGFGSGKAVVPMPMRVVNAVRTASSPAIPLLKIFFFILLSSFWA